MFGIIQAIRIQLENKKVSHSVWNLTLVSVHCEHPLWMAGMGLATACFVLFVYIHLVNHDTNSVSITRGHPTEPYKTLCTWALNTFLVARDKVEQICVCVCSKQTKIFKPCKYILDSHILSFWQLTSHCQRFLHLITQTEHLLGTRNYNECCIQTKPVKPHNCPMTVSPLYKHVHFTDEETEV